MVTKKALLSCAFWWFTDIDSKNWGYWCVRKIYKSYCWESENKTGKEKKEDRKKALVTNDDLKALNKLYHNYTFRGAQWISATVVGLTTNTGP